MLSNATVSYHESLYDGWASGPWGWSGVERVRKVVNRSLMELRHVRWNAAAIARGAAEPTSLKRLQHIHGLLATAPATVRGPMRWLVLVMVANFPDMHEDLRGMMTALPNSDFSVYHYDCRSADDANYLAFKQQPWYRSRMVHRAFVSGSGCTVESLYSSSRLISFCRR